MTMLPESRAGQLPKLVEVTRVETAAVAGPRFSRKFANGPTGVARSTEAGRRISEQILAAQAGGGAPQLFASKKAGNARSPCSVFFGRSSESCTRFCSTPPSFAISSASSFRLRPTIDSISPLRSNASFPFAPSYSALPACCQSGVSRAGAARCFAGELARCVKQMPLSPAKNLIVPLSSRVASCRQREFHALCVPTCCGTLRTITPKWFVDRTKIFSRGKFLRKFLAGFSCG